MNNNKRANEPKVDVDKNTKVEVNKDKDEIPTSNKTWYAKTMDTLSSIIPESLQSTFHMDKQRTKHINSSDLIDDARNVKQDSKITVNDDNLTIENQTTTSATATNKSGEKKHIHIINMLRQVVPTEDYKHVISAFSNLKDTVQKRMKDKSIYPEIEKVAEIRNSNELCDGEKLFLNERKNYIKKRFANYVGVPVEEINVEDIPIIAIAGSGGGFRAMIANTAYARAAQDSGLFDCCVYFAGVSGCCLSLAAQYSSLYDKEPNPIQALLDGFKKRLTTHIANPLGILKDLSNNKSPEKAVELTFGGLIQKKESDLDLRVIDIFGALLTTKLLLGENQEPDRLDFKLSEQKRFLKGGRRMMPIYTAVYHVRPEHHHNLTKEEIEKVKHYDYMSWHEFNPFEIGCDEVEEWIPAWAFGRKFENGKSVTNTPELNVGQIIGMAGSAPCVPISGYIKKFEHTTPDGWLKDGWKELSLGFETYLGEEEMNEFKAKNLIPPADNHNHAYHPPNEIVLKTRPKLELIDSGISLDLPLYPLTHPSREVDVIIAFDSSGATEKHKFFEEAQADFVKRKGLKELADSANPKNPYCEIYDYTPDNKGDGFTVPANHPFKFCYIPYLRNDKVDKGFTPCTDKRTSFATFDYTEEIIDLMIRLAKQNWLEAEARVKSTVIDAWKKKRDANASNSRH